MFGPHLILEAYGCQKEALADVGLVSRTLDAYPAKLMMTKMMPPYVFAWNDSSPEDWGVSGVVMIAESHISIHTFPEKQFVTLDIFSCREFDVEAAIEFFCSVFKPETYEQQVLMRGREYPASSGRAKNIVKSERIRFAAGHLQGSNRLHK
jgi:S-adenosylmethionine decarboxylase